jgi:hypothetical protein
MRPGLVSCASDSSSIVQLKSFGSKVVLALENDVLAPSDVLALKMFWLSNDVLAQLSKCFGSNDVLAHGSIVHSIYGAMSDLSL